MQRFYETACSSLFFTSLVEITAKRRLGGQDRTLSTIWSVKAKEDRDILSQGGDTGTQFSATPLQLICENGDERTDGQHDRQPQRWLVTRSSTSHESFPPDFRHASFLEKHRLLNRNVHVGLAFNLSSNGPTQQSGLFASVPLPVSTSLPAHLHASWIPAQDRRTIRSDAAVPGCDLPLDTQYNRIIMQELVPPLYLESLEFINREFPDQIFRFWPRRLAKQEEELVAMSLYQKLPATEHRVLRAWDDTLLSPRAALVHLHRHPEAVKKLLTALQLRPPTYVPEPSFDTDFFDEWPTLRHDSASEVAALLRQHSEAVMEICNQVAPSIGPGDIGLVLGHLVDGGESVVGMPLLPLGNGNIVQFQDGSHPHVFASHTEQISRLFGPDKVISDGIPGDVVQRLIDLPVNVGALDSKGIQYLLQRRYLEPFLPGARMEIDGQKLKWHQDLLEWIVSSDSPVPLEELASPPLIPTIDGRQLISLEHACDGTVWCRESSEDARIQPILLQLDITVVDLQTLPGPLRRTNKADVTGVLEILSQSRSNLSDLHKSVRVEDWARFAALIKSWLQPGSLSSLVAINSKTHAALASLPLFSGQHGDASISFVSSSDLYMLPHPVDPVSLAKYLPSHLTFAPFSTELSTILQQCDQSRIMSFDALFDKLNLQYRRLPESEDVSLRALLELFRNHHPRRYYQPLIPDGNRYLRVPNQLNDHTVELFSTCFHDRAHMFVHPAFRDLIDDFRRLGVHHEIRPAGMLKCIEAIDEDTRRRQDTRLRAAWLWDFINRDPRTMHGIPYSQIRRLRFIPRHIQRYQSDESLDTYASNLPSVNSPDDMCLPKYALILWTQRAPFATPPRPVVEAIYPSLGAPTIDHVVSLLP